MLRKIAIILAALTLAVGLTYCGSDTTEDPVQPTPDAGNPGDKPDAGGTPDSGTASLSCSEMTQKVERKLTVTCDGKDIGFSSGPLLFIHDDQYSVDAFGMISDDGSHLLEIDIYDAAILPAKTCHADQALPFPADGNIDLMVGAWDSSDNFTVLGGASTAGSQGTFNFDGFALTSGAWEVSFGCKDCTLASEGGKSSCTIKGSFREVTSQSL